MRVTKFFFNTIGFAASYIILLNFYLISQEFGEDETLLLLLEVNFLLIFLSPFPNLTITSVTNKKYKELSNMMIYPYQELTMRVIKFLYVKIIFGGLLFIINNGESFFKINSILSLLTLLWCYSTAINVILTIIGFVVDVKIVNYSNFILSTSNVIISAILMEKYIYSLILFSISFSLLDDSFIREFGVIDVNQIFFRNNKIDNDLYDEKSLYEKGNLSLMKKYTLIYFQKLIRTRIISFFDLDPIHSDIFNNEIFVNSKNVDEYDMNENSRKYIEIFKSKSYFK